MRYDYPTGDCPNAEKNRGQTGIYPSGPDFFSLALLGKANGAQHLIENRLDNAGFALRGNEHQVPESFGPLHRHQMIDFGFTLKGRTRIERCDQRRITVYSETSLV